MTTTPAKRPGGRPSKYTRETVERVLRAVEKGLPLSLAASAAGITHQSLVNYRREYPDFETAVQEAIVRGVEKRIAKIEAASDAGDWRASAWLLEHCQPEHFSKSRLEISGANGAPLAMGVAIYLPAKDGTPPVEVVTTKEIEP